MWLNWWHFSSYRPQQKTLRVVLRSNGCMDVIHQTAGDHGSCIICKITARETSPSFRP